MTRDFKIVVIGKASSKVLGKNLSEWKFLLTIEIRGELGWFVTWVYGMLDLSTPERVQLWNVADQKFFFSMGITINQREVGDIARVFVGWKIINRLQCRVKLSRLENKDSLFI